jgi:hypothetical protein
MSPAATAPPARTTPSTPHLNGGPVSADESTCPFWAGLEAVDEDTRRPEAGQLDHRCGSELDKGPDFLEPLGPVVPAPGEDPDSLVVEVNLNAVAVEFDLVNPSRSGRHLLDRGMPGPARRIPGTAP